MLNPGTFDRKVSFRTPNTVKTEMGSPRKFFAHSFFQYMSREQSLSKSMEQQINNRIVVPNQYIYRGHFSTLIDETLQMVDADVKYDIKSVNPIENNMFIEIVAERIIE